METETPPVVPAVKPQTQPNVALANRSPPSGSAARPRPGAPPGGAPAPRPGEPWRKPRGPAAWSVALIVVLAMCALAVFAVAIVKSFTPAPEEPAAVAPGETALATPTDATAPGVVTDESLPVAEGPAAVAPGGEAPLGETPLLAGGAPLRGGACEGTVVDSTGAPAAGALVTLTAAEPMEGYRRTATFTTRTGANGRFRAELPYPGEYRIEATNGRQAAWRERVSPGADVRLALSPPAAVAITVQNLGAEEPAAFRLTMVYPAAELEIPGERSGGTIRFAETPAGLYVFSVRAAGSYAELPVECHGGSAIEATIALPPAAVLEGIVTDGFGAPVPDAVVHARSAATGAFVDRAAADAGGCFSMAAPAGRYSLEIEAADYAPAAVSMAEAGVLQQVALSPGVLWTGAVEGRDGEVPAGARVIVEYAVPVIAGTKQKELDVSGDGRFVWRSTGAMKERFFAAAPGYGARCFSRVVPVLAPRSGEEARLPVFKLFPAEHALGGQVKDDAGGGPAGGVWVTLVPDSVPAGCPFYDESAVETDALGLFDLADGAFGSYRIYVDGEGVARQCRPLFLSVDEMLALTLEAGREVAGFVIGREGLPLGDVQVRMKDAGREFSVRTNAGGWFAFAGAPAEPLAVEVRGAEPVTAAGDEELEVHLVEGGVLSGRVAAGAAGLPVRFFQAAVVLPGEELSGATLEWHAADPDGRFAITLPAQPAQILFRRPGCEDVLVPQGELVTDRQTYTLRGGAPVVFRWAGIAPS